MKSAYAIAVVLAVVGLVVAGPALAGKKKKRVSSASVVIMPYTSGAATLDHPGRLLASNCFQCHGTNGHGMESLAGKAESEIYEELYEMGLEPAGDDIMNVYAHGFTPVQIQLIADYFSSQQP
jgi:sulfide dehydrogenase cytochrome subunit